MVLMSRFACDAMRWVGAAGPTMAGQHSVFSLFLLNLCHFAPDRSCPGRCVADPQVGR